MISIVARSLWDNGTDIVPLVGETSRVEEIKYNHQGQKDDHEDNQNNDSRCERRLVHDFLGWGRFELARHLLF